MQNVMGGREGFDVSWGLVFFFMFHNFILFCIELVPCCDHIPRASYVPPTTGSLVSQTSVSKLYNPIGVIIIIPFHTLSFSSIMLISVLICSYYWVNSHQNQRHLQFYL